MHIQPAHLRWWPLILALILWSTARSTPSDAAPSSRIFWRSMHEFPYYPRAVAFDAAIDGKLIMIASGSTAMVLESLDSGWTWRELAVSGAGPSSTFQIIAGSAADEYYAWGDNRIIRTRDGGVTWSATGYGPPCNVIDRLYVHPSDPKILYGGSRDGFVRSLDGGQTWKDPVAAECINSLVIPIGIGAGVDQPNVVYIGASYSPLSGVYRSTDYGETWTHVSTGLVQREPNITESIIDIAVDPRDADHVFALAENGQIFETVNAGSLWVLRQSGLAEPIRSIELDTRRNYSLYAISEMSLFELSDGTQTWNRVAIRPFDIDQSEDSPTTYVLRIDPTGTPNFTVFDGFLKLWITIPEIGTQYLPFVNNTR